MLYTTSSSLLIVALLSSITLAAPSWHREPGFVARHHRRHFLSRKTMNPAQDSSTSNSSTFISEIASPTASPASVPLPEPSADAYENPHRPSNPACSALFELYARMGGPGWKNQDGWAKAASHPVEASCCNWFGVTCSADGTKVIALELPNNRVRGPISNAIYSLPDLQTLNLSSNPLSTTIPPLPMSFRVLDLSHSFLYGTLSPSLFQSSSLTGIHLGNNTLDGPVDISHAENLENLFLEGNYFSEITMGPSQGKKWKRIVLRNNKIEGPFPDLSGAEDLEMVEVGNNRFTGNMFDASPLKKLVYFDIRSNLMSGPLPPLASFNTPSLKLLGISGNKFTGPVELRNADLTLAEAPISLQTCSIVVQTPLMHLPCEDVPSSGARTTWAGKCGVVRACQKGMAKRTPLPAVERAEG